MTKLMILAAALAAASPSAAFAKAPVATAQAADPVHELAHIRTTLHGAKGPLVVLVPGLSTPGAVWDDTVAALKGDHRLLVVEVKGFDGAAAPQNAKAGLIDGIVADLSADLKARGAAEASIVGHSFGGLVAMKFGLAHPRQAKQLMIVDALPFFGTVFDPKATIASVTPRAAQMRDMMLANAEIMRAAGAKARATPPTACGTGMVLDPAAACRVQAWSMSADPTVVAQAMYEDVMMDLRADIAGLTMPVTVLYQSAIDPASAKDRYETDYGALKSARLVPVDKTSHFIMLDRPDVVHESIRAMTTAR